MRDRQWISKTVVPSPIRPGLIAVAAILTLSGLTVARVTLEDQQVGAHCFAGGHDGGNATYGWPSLQACNNESNWEEQGAGPVMPWVDTDSPELFATASYGFTTTSFGVSLYAFGPEYDYFVGWVFNTSSATYDISDVASVTSVRFYGECPEMSGDCEQYAFDNYGGRSHDEPRTCSQNPKYASYGVNTCSSLLQYGFMMPSLDDLPAKLTAIASFYQVGAGTECFPGIGCLAAHCHADGTLSTSASGYSWSRNGTPISTSALHHHFAVDGAGTYILTAANDYTTHADTVSVGSTWCGMVN